MVATKVMPLQLEHSLMSPFFGRGIMIPFLHSFGTRPKRHALLHSFVSCTSISAPPCFIIFPIFRFLIASCISSLLTSPLSISSSSISSKSSRSSQHVSGSSQFSTPSKCSPHLLISSSCDFVICPSVFLNERVCGFVPPESSFTLRYRVLESPLLHASSASTVFLKMY